MLQPRRSRCESERNSEPEEPALSTNAEAASTLGMCGVSCESVLTLCRCLSFVRSVLLRGTGVLQTQKRFVSCAQELRLPRTW